MTHPARLVLWLTLGFFIIALVMPIADARLHQNHQHNHHKSHHSVHNHGKKHHHHHHHQLNDASDDHEDHHGHHHHSAAEEKVSFHRIHEDMAAHHTDKLLRPHDIPVVPHVPNEVQTRALRNRRNEDDLHKSHSATVADTTISPERNTKSEMQMDCKSTSDCKNVTNSNCDLEKKVCVCDGDLSVYIQSPAGCYKSAVLNATCAFDDQCLKAEEFSKCDNIKKICVCIPGYEMKEYPDVGVNCVTKSGKGGAVNVDPAMIGVLAGLALMFIIICVVLRLFSKARFRENRSIFNTPNPRLMNASLFKDSKLLSPARGDRRGSRASVRGPPSRAQSITSVNKDSAGRSPNGSLAKGRRGSALSTVSATGSASGGAPGSAKSPTSDFPDKEKLKETTVAVEAVD